MTVENARKLSYKAVVQGNGNLLIGTAYTAMLDLNPGDECEIKLGRKQIRLVPVGGAEESEESVIVYKLDRTSGVKAIPFLSWKSGEVTESASTRGMNLEYVIPEGRSKGLFLSKTNKVCVPLQA